VDILCAPDSLKGLGGNGTVHQIAFATANKQTQEEVRTKIAQRMLNPTPILDRQYFTSIYFREPGGVLFEVATAEPGFAIDEDKEHLGEALKLPDWYEPHRSVIEQAVTPVSFNARKICMICTVKKFSPQANQSVKQKSFDNDTRARCFC
jgi:glyoxalase family protein